MAFAASTDRLPMGDINTTPLIDVMLVLLIMLIFTIPLANHSLEFDLPNDTGKPPIIDMNPLANKVVLTADDRILWNGTPVDGPQLQAALEAAAALRPEPELQFEPDALASYELSARVLRAIKASGASKVGFVGNERYRAFGKQD